MEDPGGLVRSVLAALLYLQVGMLLYNLLTYVRVSYVRIVLIRPF